MRERAQGMIITALVLSVSPGPALTTDSLAVAVPTTNTPDHADSLTIMYAPPGSNFYEPLDYPPEKRTQLGFHGMRGKKAFDDWDKRNMLGFQGMRGKKWMDDEIDKRAVMGFHGMRGKKLYDDELIKRASMGFQGMRGKKAAMGFQGMRGKKFYPDETYELIPLLDEELEEEKRASMGFHGMRGKKDDFEKRTSMGFHGMRGKKDYEIVDEDDLAEMEKRAVMGFHGMRGKKQNEFAFKRAMGFLGMRGKKAPLNQHTDGELGSLLEYLNETSDQSASARSRRAVPIRSSKKARNAFFGMRGKKDISRESN